MKTVVLFGAGQIGAMVSRLMGPEYRVACFADNNRRKWGGTLAGILFKIRTTGRFRFVSTVAYVVMGWVAIIAIVPLIRSLQGLGTMWLTVGGGLYTLGCVFYLWKSLPYAHMVWHLFVLAGTICHFFCMLWYVM